MKEKQLTGVDLLRDPRSNKSTAFTKQEREEFGLRGLLPARIGTMDTQVERVLANMRRKESDIEKYIFLSALQERNERLYYRLIIENIREIMPLIYTPTVGQACKEFANIYRGDKGFYINIEDKGQIRKILDNWPNDDVRIIVVTDGERILGLGDLGANGMGIPIGKLSLYCACAGISPRQCMPVMLDVGTDNQEIKDDGLYLGLDRPRVRGPEYDELVAEFVEAVNDKFPGVLIQFEDFAADNAFKLLNTYRDQVLSFNDDIQGTASVVLAGVYGYARLAKSQLKDLKIMFLGAGSAASGIGDMIAQAMVQDGLTREQANERLWFFNRGGLVRKSRTDLADHVAQFAQDQGDLDFIEAIEIHQPDILIGATGTPATFTKEIVEKMAQIKSRPGIFALSNPTSRAECTAAEAYNWTEGRAVFASGSPFAAVQYQGQEFVPGQGNNAYIFPGVGLGMIACQASTIPDTVFLEAAKSLSQAVTDDDFEKGSIYPQLDEIREASLNIAVAVAEFAYENGLTKMQKPENLREYISDMMYQPYY